MVKFYFTSEKPFAKQPKEIGHLFQDFTCPYEYASATIDDLLTKKFEKSFELHPIYEINIQEPTFHVHPFHHKNYKITNIGGDTYQEIDYHKLIPYNHLYAIAKGINQEDFEIDINNKELLYALICRGYEKDLEKIINYWQKGEVGIYQNSHIATLFVTHHANKYGDFFLSETKYLADSNLLAAYAKYGTTEQQDHLLRYREHGHILMLADCANTELKQKLLNEKSELIKEKVLFNTERNELNLTTLLKTRSTNLILNLIDKTNDDEFRQLLKNILGRSFMAKLNETSTKMLVERCMETCPDLLDNLVDKINQLKFNSSLFRVNNNKFRNKLIDENPNLSTKDKITLIRYGGYPYAQLFKTDISKGVIRCVEECLYQQNKHIQSIKDYQFFICERTLNLLSNENLNKSLEENIAPFKKEAIRKVLDKRREAGQY